MQCNVLVVPIRTCSRDLIKRLLRRRRFPVSATLLLLLLSSSLLLSSLELSDRKVYEPQERALLGTASHFCEVALPRGITAAPRFYIGVTGGSDTHDPYTVWLCRSARSCSWYKLITPLVSPRSTAAVSSGDTTPCRMTGVTLHSHVR